MRKSYQELEQKLTELQMVIEDVSAIMPSGTTKNYKLKKKLEHAWGDVAKAMNRHEMLITDAVPKINFDMPSKKKEFLNVWQEYIDFMIEQHGTRMGSRMQKNRLELLMQLAGDDIDMAVRFLKYYMASGSANIYFVNEEKIIANEKGKQDTNKPGFSF